MSDLLTLTSEILGVIALLGAMFAVWQLTRIRMTLGPLRPFVLRSDLGTIIVEHIAALVTWLVLLVAYYLANEFANLSSDHHGWIQFALLIVLTLIVWGFTLRAHLWYRQRE